MYTRRLFFLNILDALWQSVCMAFIPVLAYWLSDISLFELGTIYTTTSVLVSNLHLALDVYHWTWVHHAAIWGSVVVYFIFSLSTTCA